MATSMVKGNPVKLMLSFAFPLLIGNLLQQTYNIIDAAIVGQALGPEALASVGASSSVQFLVLSSAHISDVRTLLDLLLVCLCGRPEHHLLR